MVLKVSISKVSISKVSISKVLVLGGAGFIGRAPKSVGAVEALQ